MAKLMPFFLLLVVSTMMGCCLHSGVMRPREKASFVDELKSDTVALVHRDGDGDIATFCTGVWVSKDEILTADHCAKAPIEATLGVDVDEGGAEAMTIVELFEKGFEIQYVIDRDATGVYREPKAVHVATVSKFDSKHDLALLKVKDPPAHHVAMLADNTPLLGEDIHVMGHPSALAWTYVHAYVAAYREEKFMPMKRKDGPWLQLSGPVWKGNSGGGAFNSNGELVGVCSFLGPAPETIFFVHLETVRSFLGRPVPR